MFPHTARRSACRPSLESIIALKLEVMLARYPASVFGAAANDVNVCACVFVRLPKASIIPALVFTVSLHIAATASQFVHQEFLRAVGVVVVWL